jgi:flagellar hook-length control protein FliK
MVPDLQNMVPAVVPAALTASAQGGTEGPGGSGVHDAGSSADAFAFMLQVVSGMPPVPELPVPWQPAAPAAQPAVPDAARQDLSAGRALISMRGNPAPLPMASSGAAFAGGLSAVAAPAMRDKGAVTMPARSGCAPAAGACETPDDRVYGEAPNDGRIALRSAMPAAFRLELPGRFSKNDAFMPAPVRASGLTVAPVPADLAAPIPWQAAPASYGSKTGTPAADAGLSPVLSISSGRHARAPVETPAGARVLEDLAITAPAEPAPPIAGRNDVVRPPADPSPAPSPGDQSPAGWPADPNPAGWAAEPSEADLGNPAPTPDPGLCENGPVAADSMIAFAPGLTPERACAAPAFPAYIPMFLDSVPSVREGGAPAFPQDDPASFRPGGAEMSPAAEPGVRISSTQSHDGGGSRISEAPDPPAPAQPAPISFTDAADAAGEIASAADGPAEVLRAAGDAAPPVSRTGRDEAAGREAPITNSGAASRASRQRTSSTSQPDPEESEPRLIETDPSSLPRPFDRASRIGSATPARTSHNPPAFADASPAAVARETGPETHPAAPGASPERAPRAAGPARPRHPLALRGGESGAAVPPESMNLESAEAEASASAASAEEDRDPKPPAETDTNPAARCAGPAKAGSDAVAQARPDPDLARSQVWSTPAPSHSGIEAEALAGGSGALSPEQGLSLSELPSALPRIVRLAVRQGAREARIQLAPPELGSIRVRLRVEGDRVTAQFTAERAEVRSLLEQTRGDLDRGLDASGLRLQRFEIQAPESGGAKAGSALRTGQAHSAAESTPAPLPVLQGRDASDRAVLGGSWNGSAQGNGWSGNTGSGQPRRTTGRSGPFRRGTTE